MDLLVLRNNPLKDLLKRIFSSDYESKEFEDEFVETKMHEMSVIGFPWHYVNLYTCVN